MKPSVSTENRHPYLEVRNSKIHGKGVYAKGPIAPRTRIIEYTGEKISHRESDRRELLRQEQKSEGKPSDIFMFELDDRWYIDGSKKGSIARFINHSCDANCTPYLSENRIWFYSNRTIRKGEELSIDYGFDFQVWRENPCRCAAKSCIGFIVRKNVRWRVLAQLKRAKPNRD